ncbi:MAG TPA: toll/interleukin-1 receptor domain-containing protein, partial [Pseudonocardiaceae bacterium]|nr:toll/interleukin-1 receptor domain-containing protein [Pseudonocardiaceae bacterium]
MVDGRNPDQLDGVHRSREYDVFLSYAWADKDAVSTLQRALEQRGLRVFVDDKRIDEFAGITEELVIGLASSKVLLAYYSKRYPTRPACQWELTAAFIAGQRAGDPRRRVLAVNPEPGAGHLFPVEIEDARYFPAPHNDAERTRLADRVVAAARAVSGPLGQFTGTTDLRLLGPEVLASRPTVYRYPQLWQLHTALHTRDVPGVRVPTPAAAAALSGISGSGKTSIAIQYGFLFREAFPGGVLFVSAAGSTVDRGRLDVTFYTVNLHVAAGRLLGVDL